MKLSQASVIAVLSTHVAVANSASCFANNPSLTFDTEGESGTYFEQGIADGDQFGWSNRTILDMAGSIVGQSAGTCTVIAEDTANATLTNSLCSSYQEFTAGPFAGSTVLFEGIYNEADAATTGINFTICGGSGCFAGIAGYTHWIALNNGTLFRETWYLQSPPSPPTTSGGGATGATVVPRALLIAAGFMCLRFAYW